MEDSLLETLALLALGIQIGFLLYGVIVSLTWLYFAKFHESDPVFFQALVGISLLLETAATAILLRLNWVLVVEGDQWPFKSLIVVYFLRIPTQLLSQVYFIYRSWSLNDRKRILIYFWSFLLFAEVALAIPFGANIANEDRTRDLTEARPGQYIFLSYIILGSFINLNVALIFAFRLLSMKSPFQRSRGVLFRILAHSFAGNVTSGALAIFIGVLWTSRIDAWFTIPVEILAKVYPCVLLLALLAREDARNEMTDPSRVGAPGVINLRIDTGMELDFLDEDARRRYSCASVELSSSPEEISQFLYYRPDKPRRRRS